MQIQKQKKSNPKPKTKWGGGAQGGLLVCSLTTIINAIIIYAFMAGYPVSANKSQFPVLWNKLIYQAHGLYELNLSTHKVYIATAARTCQNL